MNSKYILFLFLVILFSCVDILHGKPTGKGKADKPTCLLPSQNELRQLIELETSYGIEQILEYRFSCSAVRAFNRYHSAAVVISFNSSSQSPPTVVHTVIECISEQLWEIDSNQWKIKEDNYSTIVDQLPPTQTQCYKCTAEKPESGPGSENAYNSTTWCLECSENCKAMGGGFCVSPSTYSCCPYFTKEEGVCTDECEVTNGTSNCIEECEGNWTGTDCKECSLECSNGGTPDSTTCSSCICPNGFTGTYCDDPLPTTAPPTDPTPTPCDECFNNGILNELNCSCVCPSGYTGIRCEELVDPCDPNPCLNGGTCVSMEEDMTHSCVCPSGWTGDHCETRVPVDPCLDYCKNGGICTVSDDGEPVCDCSETDGYTGPTCEEYDECRDNPCENGGTCVDNGQSIECQCPDGYTGSRCKERECPCLNGGVCESIEGEIICICPDDYLGPVCQYPNPCIPNPCLNGGTCTFSRGVYDSFTCTCQSGWTGARCDTCIDTGDFNECGVQPTEDLRVEESPKNRKTGLIIGITIAVLLTLMLFGSLLLLGFMVYRRFLRTDENLTNVDTPFDGSKVTENPVFIRPDDLSIEESVNTKIIA